MDLPEWGEPHRPVTVRQGQVGQRQELRRGEVALGQCGGDDVVIRARLLADVRAAQRSQLRGLRERRNNLTTIAGAEQALPVDFT